MSVETNETDIKEREAEVNNFLNDFYKHNYREQMTLFEN